MKTITIQRSSVNIEALDAALQAVFGNRMSGISTGKYGVQVHLADDATPQEISQAKSIVTNHDPSVLTPEQQAEAQRQAVLEQARTANATPLNVGDYSGQTALIQALAQKISWLEQEITDLRRSS